MKKILIVEDDEVIAEVQKDYLAASGFEEWTSLIRLTVASAAFALESTVWGGGGGTLDPGESGTLAIEVRNVGSRTGSTAVGLLSCDSPWVVVTDESGSFGDVGVDGTASGNFALAISLLPDQPLQEI